MRYTQSKSNEQLENELASQKELISRLYGRINHLQFLLNTLQIEKGRIGNAGDRLAYTNYSDSSDQQQMILCNRLEEIEGSISWTIIKPLWHAERIMKQIAKRLLKRVLRS